MSKKKKKIRNFCIISHIDHGKSTMADRMLEMTNTVEKRQMSDQHLDLMDLEKERGITIKMQPVSMKYSKNGVDFTFNLIDTPGHIDFSYEVSRSLKAVEGAILLVDASQGIQAQTIDVLEKAKTEDLVIIPVVNKVDLEQARPEETAQEIIDLTGVDQDEIIFASGKTGEGVEEILKSVVDNIPSPEADEAKKTKALIFDSHYDNHLGVIAHIRLISGKISPVDNSDRPLSYFNSKVVQKPKGVGIFTPEMVERKSLAAGQIGYLVTGLKDINKVLIGDTISHSSDSSTTPLAGFKKVKPKVFLSFYPSQGSKFNNLKQALSKISLSDSSLTISQESSPAFGRGMRIGFLGLLHADIILERLKREHELELITTSPSVEYLIKSQGKSEEKISDPGQFPNQSDIQYIKEPFVKLEILSPKDYFSKIMDLMKREEAEFIKSEYLTTQSNLERMRLHYRSPLRTIIQGFSDKLKNISQGYGSFNYRIIDYDKNE